MAFPTDKTVAVDGVTEIIAAHLNHLEDKVGINNSADPNSLDYQLFHHDHQAPVGVKLDHGLAITGLLDDDHTQYALLAGRASGQTLCGGVAADENLYLTSTFHATKGKIYLGANSVYDEVNDRLGINCTPNYPLCVYKTGVQFTGDVYLLADFIYGAVDNFGIGLGYNNSNGNAILLPRGSSGRGFEFWTYDTGWVSRLTLSKAGLLDLNGTIRSMGASSPSTGAGLEFSYLAGIGYIYAYDRDAPGGKPLWLNHVGTDTIINSAGGKVGIGGITTPVYSIDITGNLRCSTGFGCNGATPQTAYASGGGAGAVAGTATSGGYGFVDAVEMNAFITAVNVIKDLANNIRSALVADGIMS